MNDAPLPPLGEVIRRYGLRARRNLGQNYILETGLLNRIARAAGPLEESVMIEIGPGPGGLSRALLEGGARKVIAIERDRRFVPALDEIALWFPDRFEFLSGDARSVDLARFSDLEGDLRISGNLPFNIASRLISFWLASAVWPPVFSSITVTVQREVGKRITALPGTKDYGFLSILCQWRMRAWQVFPIASSVFTPRPKVLASLVRLEPLPAPCSLVSLPALKRVAMAAFSQRRKMLRTSLKQLGGDILPLLSEAGIDPDLRPEQISVKEFCILAAIYQRYEVANGRGLI